MPSSTSSSEPATAPGGSSVPAPFVAGAIGWLALLAALVVVATQVAGRLYHPGALEIGAADQRQHDRLLLIFGNSRLEAGIDPPALGTRLGAGALMFSGGGWHALHYQQLALLNAPWLRAGHDVVVVDASLVSLQLTNPDRLGVIRPATAVPIATLPGLPFEARLDLLLGAVNPVYRYRTSIQGQLLERLQPVAEGLARRLPSGLPPEAPAYRLVTDPAHNWVMRSIEGDRAAFRRESRERSEKMVGHLAPVTVQREALARATERLRQTGAEVLLVEMPLSHWLTDRLPVAVVADHQRWLDDLAARTGARVARHWPTALSDDDLFYDDQHFFSAAMPPFTRALADELQQQFPTVYPPPH